MIIPLMILLSSCLSELPGDKSSSNEYPEIENTQVVLAQKSDTNTSDSTHQHIQREVHAEDAVATRKLQNEAKVQIRISEGENVKNPVERESKSYGKVTEVKESVHLNDPNTMEVNGGTNLSFDHGHTSWNSLLNNYVSTDGKVNYISLKKEEKQLDQYLATLSAQNPKTSTWTSSQRMAFWINAYNAFTIKIILKNYPVASILEIDNGKVWDRKWIDIGNEIYSLNQIEHEILRPLFKDPRIHFAVNCAAVSCPPLWNQAWTEQNLEMSLKNRTKMFLNNKKYNQITVDKLTLSKIFEWYADDFGNIYDFVQKYSTTTFNNGARITFIKYNWKLNKM